MITHINYPLYDYATGGLAGGVHMAVANGFPPETYAPIITALSQHAALGEVTSSPPGRADRAVSVLPRPLWTPPPPPDDLRSWRQYADDLRAGMTQHGLYDQIGIGHSLGGIVTLIAAEMDAHAAGRSASEGRSLFRALVLLDPVVFGPRFIYAMRIAQWLGQTGRSPLVKQALRRKSHFGTQDEAFAYWRGKSLFKDWNDDALRLYVSSALYEATDGWRLRWPAAWEARAFSTGYTGIWRTLRRVPRLPVLLLRGSSSTTLPPAIVEAVRRLRPDFTFGEIEGGHLFPHTAPAATAQAIHEWVAQL